VHFQLLKVNANNVFKAFTSTILFAPRFRFQIASTSSTVAAKGALMDSNYRMEAAQTCPTSPIILIVCRWVLSDASAATKASQLSTVTVGNSHPTVYRLTRTVIATAVSKDSLWLLEVLALAR